MIITGYWFSIIHGNTEEILEALMNGSEHRCNVVSNVFLSEPKTIFCIFWGDCKKKEAKRSVVNFSLEPAE